MLVELGEMVVVYFVLLKRQHFSQDNIVLFACFGVCLFADGDRVVGLSDGWDNTA